MNVSTDFPPNIEQIRAALDISNAQPIFTYGDTIYNPYRHALDPGLIAHEEVHERQQREIGGPDVWWTRYLAEPEFRAEQEIAAYRKHFKTLRKARADRNFLARCLDHWARELAGAMYGGCVPYAVALVRIKG